MRKAFRNLRSKVKVPFQNAGSSSSHHSSLQYNNNSAGQLSPSPQLPSTAYDSDAAIDNRAGLLSPPLTTVSQDSNLSAEHSRPPSQVSIRSSNRSVERLRPQNDILRDDTSDIQQQQASHTSENGPSQTTDVLTQTPTFYDVQSHRGNLTQVRRVSMHSANIYEVHGNQNNYYGNTGPLELLAKRAMLEATFDSSDRDPPPRCHPHTRHDILQSIQEKIHGSDEKAKIMWMKGGAGAGKSAIMQTVAEAEAESNTLGASLFFSRASNRNDPRKVFTTIAYQLAIEVPTYKEYLTQRIVANPSFMTKTLEKQFQDLIVVPFVHQKLLSSHHNRVVLIDGLDECEGSREQCRIIELIHNFVLNDPTIPLLWIIASRPEEHLLDAFLGITMCSQIIYWEIEVPIDSEQSVRDVELYLHDKFREISKRYRRLMPADGKWPSEKQFLVISRAASGLFVFASTVMLFIDNDENPMYRLDVVVSVIEKHLKELDSRTNPLETLDKLYERILAEISSDTLKITRLILGYLIISQYLGTLGLDLEPFWICNILGLEQHAMYGALRKLRSVLAFPEPQNAYRDKVHFLHASFPDYLRDEKRSHIYYVNLDEIATLLWTRFMTILQQWEKNHSLDDVEFSWTPEAMKVISVEDGVMPRRWYLVDGAGYFWPLLLEGHLERNPDTNFCLLLSLEDLIEQLKQRDYSYLWTISADAGKTDRIIKCLEKHVPINLYKYIIQDVPFVSLDKNQFLRSLYERQWSSYNTGNKDFSNLDGKTEQDFGGDFNKLEHFLREEASNTGFILDLMKDANSAKYVGKVLGVRPSKCRVVLRDAESGAPLHCFPYIA